MLDINDNKSIAALIFDMYVLNMYFDNIFKARLIDTLSQYQKFLLSVGSDFYIIWLLILQLRSFLIPFSSTDN